MSHPGCLTRIVLTACVTCIVSPRVSNLYCLIQDISPVLFHRGISPVLSHRGVSPVLSYQGVSLVLSHPRFHLYCLNGVSTCIASPGYLACIVSGCLTGKPRLYSLIQGSHLYYLTQGVAPWCDNTGETPRGLTPVKLASDYRPVCQQSWSQDLLLCRTRRSSLAVAGATASTHSCLPTEGWLRLGQPGCLVLCRGGLPVQMRSNTVTHPGTNRDGRRVTTLIASNALPLRHTDTSRHKSQK